MNINLLRSHIKRNGMTQAEVADKIGISESRFSAKANEYNGAEFSMRDVRELKRIFGLSPQEVDEIFFDK